MRAWPGIRLLPLAFQQPVGPAHRAPCIDDTGPLKDFSSRACKDPDSLTQAEVDEVWWCVNTSAFPQDLGRYGLYGCEAAVFRKFKTWKYRAAAFPAAPDMPRDVLRQFVDKERALQPRPSPTPPPTQPGPGSGNRPIWPCVRMENGRCVQWASAAPRLMGPSSDQYAAELRSQLSS